MGHSGGTTLTLVLCSALFMAAGIFMALKQQNATQFEVSIAEQRKWMERAQTKEPSEVDETGSSLRAAPEEVEDLIQLHKTWIHNTEEIVESLNQEHRTWIHNTKKKNSEWLNSQENNCGSYCLSHA
jgi:uncharacterized protein HemX